MVLTHLELRNFRNHTNTVVDCTEGINVFLGDNGEGKTNLLEAISYLCLTKSFLNANDRTVLMNGENAFSVKGIVFSTQGTKYNINVEFHSDINEKKYTLNDATVLPLSSIIGEFPVVILSPEYRSITFNMPSDRRRFIDMIISQASRSYFEDLQEYRRILRQRNRILMDARKTGTDCLDLLEPWDDGFVNRGARIIHRRSAFEKEFLPYIVQAYDNIAGRAEIPSIKYFSNVPFENGQKLEQTELRFKEELKRNHNTGLRLGSTPSGTHRDELSFTINDMDIRKYASQGQHKTFLLALKIAEFHYLKERCAEIPILLLDDVFSELDEHRSRSLLSLVESLGQPFITATSSTVFNTGSRLITPIKRYVVRQGTVIDEKTEETYRRSIASSDSN